MKNIAKKHIFSVKPYVPGKPIEEVKRDLRLRNVVKLASNENPYGPSPRVREAIRRACGHINRYPESNCYYLRKELAKKLKVRESQLIFSNGSDEIIVMANRAFLNKGDEVIIAYPSFMIYEIASKLEGARVQKVPLKNFRYDLDGMLRKINRRTKIIFIGNPDNPAGTYIPEKELIRFIRRVPSRIVIFVDEAYHEYVQQKDYPQTIRFLKRYKNLIVTRTFSKLYGLAGLRIGYGIANPELINILERVREPFNVNLLAQDAARACLKDGPYYKKRLKGIKRQKEFLYRSLQKVGVKYQKSYTNFILIDTQTDGSRVARRLLRKGIIVRDMAFWGLNQYIRVTIGTAKENKKFIQALREVL